MIFGDFRSQLDDLIGKGALADAQALVDREGDAFPRQAARIRLWRMGLACRMNDIPQALQLFDMALARGGWLPESWLRAEPDLAPLRETPEFERMLRLSQQREAAAHFESIPRLLTLRPETGAVPPYPLLIALHGNFRSASASVEHWHAAAAAGWQVALPQSSQIFVPDSYIWDDLDRGVREVQEHYRALCDRADVDCGRVVLAGFSAGGRLAATVTLAGHLPVQGLIVVASSLGEVEAFTATLAERKEAGLRVFLVAGELDPTSIASAETLRNLLEAHGIPVQLEVHPALTHDFPPDFDQTLRRALRFVADGQSA